MGTSEFEKLVKKSLMEMSENIRKAMDNVAIVISQIPNEFELKQTGIRYGATLLGFYQGVPKTVRNGVRNLFSASSMTTEQGRNQTKSRRIN